MRTSLLGLSLIAAAALPTVASAQTYDCATTNGSTNCSRGIDDGRGELASTILVLPGACPTTASLVDANLHVSLAHQSIGDLAMSLAHPDGTTVQFLYRPGIGAYRHACVHDDLDVTFDDEATDEVTDACAGGAPAASGSMVPFNPLAAFDGRGRNGVWTLRVKDLEGGGYGALLGWSLILPCTLPTIEIESSDGVLEERDTNRTATLVVRRSGDMTTDLTVRYAVSGSASTSDFDALPGTIVIPAGQATAELVISAVDDDLEELEEQVDVTIESGDYEIGTRSQADAVFPSEREQAGAQGSSDGCGCHLARSASPTPWSSITAIVVTASIVARRLRRRRV